jgi:hypothetical protein
MERNPNDAYSIAIIGGISPENGAGNNREGETD